MLLQSVGRIEWKMNWTKQQNLLNIKQFAIESTQQELEAAEQEKIAVEVAVQDKEATIKKKDKIHDVWSGSHAIIMMRTNDPKSKMPYYAIRRKQKTMSKVVKKFRTKYPHSIMIYQNLHVPNPINMYNRLKACKGIIRFKGNYCASKVGEAALIDKLTEVFTIVKN